MDLSAEQVASFERDGFLAVPDAIPHEACDELRVRAEQIVDEFDPETVSIFSTHEQTRTSDDYFLESGDHIRCLDRKSTRLNSSHVASSYAVCCMTKKK